jgi:hypothetical protein
LPCGKAKTPVAVRAKRVRYWKRGAMAVVVRQADDINVLPNVLKEIKRVIFVEMMKRGVLKTESGSI